MSEPNICPICGCKELEYDSVQLNGDMLYYPWTCCANAEHTGEEWYNLIFAGHNIKT